LRLNINVNELAAAVNGKILQGPSDAIIQQVQYDSRNIHNGAHSAFFALQGSHRKGNDFIHDAYDKGVRCFVAQAFPNVHGLEEATLILVEDSLDALQALAASHRERFSYPVIAITGSSGKTTVKEWLYHLLSGQVRVIRSPKSYNSQIGVALSLLELNEDCDVALIEAGISQPGEMERLEKMIRPTYGIFTSFGRAHEENFKSTEEQLNEKLKLFKGVQKTYYPASINLNPEIQESINAVPLSEKEFKTELSHLPYDDAGSRQNAVTVIGTIRKLFPDLLITPESIVSLPRLALRLETFEGINGCTIINDTYNLDLDALTQSLEYQLRVAEGRKRVVLLGLDKESETIRKKADAIVQQYAPDHYIVLEDGQEAPTNFKDAVILLKGSRQADMQRYVRTFRLKNHKTFVEIDLSHLKHNLDVYRSLLPASTKILAMVKAQSYGSGIEKVSAFLERNGIDYLGVAYADEGVELRKQGIQCPIVVMNTEEEGFEDCIHYQLEPAIYSFRQLDAFIHELILHQKTAFPIHLKLDTGMRRLGFEMQDIPRICEMIQAQPEVWVKGVYSHLADSDNRRDKRFTDHQISHFAHAASYLEERLQYKLIKHLSNSEGIINYPSAAFDIVRLGIGMYGITSHPQLHKRLKPVLSWNSSISQIKSIRKGESVGYSRTFIADKETRIATIPVGYADGFRRSLSNGKGVVIINGKKCPTVGRVCMDMIMVNITGVDCREGDRVEIIGKTQTIDQLAKAMDTIPYEVMTSISKRVHRVYLEE